MGNLIAVGAHCRRGDEIIVGTNSHMICYEAAGASAFMGVSYSALDNQTDGGMAVKDIEGAIREDDPHYPRSDSMFLKSQKSEGTNGASLSVATSLLPSPQFFPLAGIYRESPPFVVFLCLLPVCLFFKS